MEHDLFAWFVEEPTDAEIREEPTQNPKDQTDRGSQTDGASAGSTDGPTQKPTQGASAGSTEGPTQKPTEGASASADGPTQKPTQKPTE